MGIDRTWHGISIWRNGLVLNWMGVVVVQLQRLTKDHRCTRTLGTVWPVGDRSRSCQVWGERRQTRRCRKNPFSNLGNGWGRAVRPAALCGPRWSIRLTSFSFDPHPPAEDSDSSTEAPGLPPPSSPRPAATSAPFLAVTLVIRAQSTERERAVQLTRGLPPRNTLLLAPGP